MEWRTIERCIEGAHNYFGDLMSTKILPTQRDTRTLQRPLTPHVGDIDLANAIKTIDQRARVRNERIAKLRRGMQ
jgi:hypothetical protein